MSSFKITAKHKATKEIHEIWCYDDYFARHVYGYVPNIEGGQAMREKDFYEKYTPVEPSTGIREKE